MRQGELSPAEVVKAHLDRIAETDSIVKAWEFIDADGAMRTAKKLSQMRPEQRRSLPLFGLPIGVKDIFQVRGLPTRAGFAPYKHNVAGCDAAAVARLRDAGAIVLGKTVTAQFAWADDPPKTRNPWNVSRTPGGSSSGSAAAVAARQVPAALGTQTGGSVLRPAAFCGVVGFKPSFGRISRHGILPTSWSFDHVGIVGRSAEDAALLLTSLSGYDHRDPHSWRQRRVDFLRAAKNIELPRSLGIVREAVERVERSVRYAFEDSISRLVEAGAKVLDVTLPTSIDTILAIFAIISCCEGAASHADQASRLTKYYRAGARANAEIGQLLPAAAYVQAARLRRRFRPHMDELFADVGAVMLPTTTTLPTPRSTTGDYSLQTIWSVFGLPTISLPTHLDVSGLPHGIQLVGRFGDDANLLGFAAWSESHFPGVPPNPSALREGIH